MRQEFIDLYDEYTHKPLARREFLHRLARLAGGVAGAYAILPFLETNYARGAIVPSDDARLVTAYLTFPGAQGEMQGYRARPADSAGQLPAVMVIHENRGLNPHIEEVTRRMALEGFIALAPDFLSPMGGTPDDADQARELISQLDSVTTRDNALAALAYLETHPDSTGKVGAIGFCWGGGLCGQIATHAPDLDAAVVFYGRVPESDDVARIKAPLLLHYAGLDQRINADMPAFRAALDQHGVDYTLHMYEGVNHAFHNDTSEARYNREAAELAWSRTIAFLKEHLG